MHNQDDVKVLDENRAKIKQRLMQHESSSRAVTGTDQRQTKKRVNERFKIDRHEMLKIFKYIYSWQRFKSDSFQNFKTGTARSSSKIFIFWQHFNEILSKIFLHKNIENSIFDSRY